MISVDGTIYNFLGKREKVYHAILPAADEKPMQSSYTEDKPAADWTSISFSDKGWKTAMGPAGSEPSQAKTPWKKDEIWVRRTFNLNEVSKNKMFLKIRHDDNATAYLNGKEIYSAQKLEGKFVYVPIDESVKKLLKNGSNVLAVYAKNTGGPSFLDVGLVEEPNKADEVKVAEAVQKSLDFNATQTIYTFKAGTVDLKVTFTSPLLMNDLNLLARPVTYVSTLVNANDGKEHEVKFYFGASTTIATHTAFQEVEAQKYNQAICLL